MHIKLVFAGITINNHVNPLIFEKILMRIRSISLCIHGFQASVIGEYHLLHMCAFYLMWSLECIRPFDVVVSSILRSPLFALSSGRNCNVCIKRKYKLMRD